MSTVVSVTPFTVKYEPPGIYPGVFEIPPAKDGDFEILHVNGDHVHYIYVGEGRSISVKLDPNDIAAAIVRDFCMPQLAYDVDSHPGLFWVSENLTKLDVESKYKTRLQEVREKQTRWFKKLVMLADDDWAKNHQHKSISDLQRFAAKSLKLNRDWIATIETNLIQCPFCTKEVPNNAIKCPNCLEIVKPEEYKKLTAGVK